MATTEHGAKRSSILAQQDAEAKEARDAKQVVHVFLWTLFVFKIITLAVLVIWIDPRDVWLLIGVSAWPWFVIPGIALAGPIGYQIRLRRMRRKRESLRRAEWAETDNN